MRRRWVWVALLVCLAQGTAAANPEPSWPRSYADGVTRKLGRAVANIFTAPLELARKPILVHQRDGGVAASTVGVTQGLKAFGVRFAAGFVELLTFPMPFPDGRFQPLVRPEFVFSHGEWVAD